ncbi:MAG: HAD-IA family hydrolase [Rhodobacter sp.]|nr:HAD-IA family hydrolase [Rhodobacter sp.]
MTRPDLVIFDCDGVLVDSEPITNELLQQDFAQRGLTLSQQEIDRMFTGGTMRAVGQQAAAMGADIRDGWVEAFYETMYVRLAEGTPLIPGVEQVLDRLDTAGIPYCVGSNGSLRKMAITLGQHPALHARLTDRLYSAHVHGTAKPDPGLFLIAAGEFGVPPSRCAVVDDSVSGCTAASRAGMRCFGFAAHDDGTRLAATGATVFHRMADLPALLQI